MSKQDAAVVRILTDLGLRKEEPLTPEQEESLKQASDPEEKYYADIVRVFGDSCKPNS